MKTLIKLVLLGSALLFATPGFAQTDVDDVAEVRDVDEVLTLAIVELLMSAPDEKALPRISKVLAGNHSTEVKEAAMFVLSQIDLPEAQTTLVEFASDASGELQIEAIRMIGIGGSEDALSNLKGIYESGNSEAREAVLEAFMIAGDEQAVFEIAAIAEGNDYEAAVEMLAVMGATEELRQLRSTKGVSEALIGACAVSGDFECLRELALDDSDVDMQTEAIAAMGIVGGDRVNATLVEIYGNADSDDIREAALDGMLFSGNDSGVLELYRSSSDAAEKKVLLEYLVFMGSDDVWDIIDATLDGDR